MFNKYVKSEWSHEFMLSYFINLKTLILSHTIKLLDFGEHSYYVNVHTKCKMNLVVGFFLLTTKIYLDLMYTCTWTSEYQINNVSFFMSVVFNLNEHQLCSALRNMLGNQDLDIFLCCRTLFPTTLTHEYIL